MVSGVDLAHRTAAHGFEDPVAVDPRTGSELPDERQPFASGEPVAARQVGGSPRDHVAARDAVRNVLLDACQLFRIEPARQESEDGVLIQARRLHITPSHSRPRRRSAIYESQLTSTN